MRLLCVSDIHGKLSAVERLRARESGTFDAVIVAGDIGSLFNLVKVRDDAEVVPPLEILNALRAFGGPVLYVSGNHDRDLPHDADLGDGVHHLHLNAAPIGDMIVIGLSDGETPLTQQVHSKVDDRHSALLAQVAEMKATEAAQAVAIEAEFAAAMSDLDGRTRDKRRLVYKEAVSRLGNTKTEALRRSREALRNLGEGSAWQTYLAEHNVASGHVSRLEREALAAIVQAEGAGRCVVVTHDRLTATPTDLAGVPLFLFGHRHGFSDTTYRGSRFVRVSALGDMRIMEPKTCLRLHDHRAVDFGAYVTIEINSAGSVSVNPHRFMETPQGWKRVENEWLFADRHYSPYRPGVDEQALVQGPV